MDALETIKEDKGIIEIYPDEDAQDPRTEWDNLGTMVCFHGRYNLGDNHDLTTDMFAGWDEMQAHLVKELKAALVLPLYLYDHSGITMNTTGFSYPWDSGQVGFIYMTREAALSAEWTNKKGKPYKVWCAGLARRVQQCLESEVEAYDTYIRGEVYGYTAKDLNGEVLGSCWGYYGSDHEESGLLESARMELAAI